MTDGSKKSLPQLARIAELLGCPVESFLAPDPGRASLVEFCEVWSELGEQDRADVLDYARARLPRHA